MDYNRCPDGEDFVFLAHCAVAKDFSLLTTGVVLPHYLSDMGAMIANWVLERKYTPDADWPPSLGTLQEMFPDLPWPDMGGRDYAGLDPEAAASDVLQSYNVYSAGIMQRLVVNVMRKDLDHEDRNLLLDRIESISRELRHLLEAKNNTVTLGEDTDKILDAILGKGKRMELAKIKTPFAWLDSYCRPYRPGIYCFFARPKHGKSWVLQMIAAHVALEVGTKVMIVDPELAEEEIIQRISSLIMKANYGELSKIDMKNAEGEPLSEAQQRIVDDLPELVAKLHVSKNLVILGKDKINPELGGFTIDEIIQTAKEHEVSVICAEQVHKYVNPRSSKNASDAMRAHHSITQMANAGGFLWFATTQQNREHSPKPGKVPVPDDRSIFGSDAIAQNAHFLCYIWKLQIDDAERDEDKSLMWMFVPVLSRSSVATEPRFVHFRPGDIYEEWDPEYGLAFAEAQLEMKEQEKATAKKRAKQMVKSMSRGNQKVAGIPAGEKLDPSSSITRYRAAHAKMSGGMDAEEEEDGDMD